MSIFEQALKQHTHRMHGGTEYYSHDGIWAAFREIFPGISADDVRHHLKKVRPTLDQGEFYTKADILAAMDRENDIRCESSGPI